MKVISILMALYLFYQILATKEGNYEQHSD